MVQKILFSFLYQGRFPDTSYSDQLRPAVLTGSPWPLDWFPPPWTPSSLVCEGPPILITPPLIPPGGPPPPWPVLFPPRVEALCLAPPSFSFKGANPVQTTPPPPATPFCPLPNPGLSARYRPPPFPPSRTLVAPPLTASQGHQKPHLARISSSFHSPPLAAEAPHSL